MSSTLKIAVHTVMFAGLCLAAVGLVLNLGGLLRQPAQLDAAALEQTAEALEGAAGPAPAGTAAPAEGELPGLAVAWDVLEEEQAPTLEPSPEPSRTPRASLRPGETEPVLPLEQRITPVSTPRPAAPRRLRIPRIDVDAPVLPSPAQLVEVDGVIYQQWVAPDRYAAGWQQGSAQAGQVGNLVLNGHHNIDGKIFERLGELLPGDVVEVAAGQQVYGYLVTQVMVLEERGLSPQQRAKNAQWLLPSTDERLTLVSCWPPTNNTHRIIVVASRWY